MRIDEQEDANLTPVSWLARARAQSQQLAELRAADPPPLRAKMSPGRWSPARPSLVWIAVGAAILLLVGSGAWALVGRLRDARRPAPRSTPAAARTATTRTPVLAETRPLPPPAPSPPRHRRGKPATFPSSPLPSTKSSGPAQLERGEGEIIIVAPRPEQPPLFSPEEFKQQHSQPQQ